MQKQQSSVTVICKLVVTGQTSIVLVVLGAVNLQFQGPFVPIPLRPILRIVAEFSEFSCPGCRLAFMKLTFPPGVLVSVRQFTGYGPEYYL